MAGTNRIHVLLTGPPGVGKTTLQKVTSALSGRGVELRGFYTEEVREGGGGGDGVKRGGRTGFDVVTFDGRRAPLARVHSGGVQQSQRKPKVGRYLVELRSFEQLALPTLTQSTTKGLRCKEGSHFPSQKRSGVGGIASVGSVTNPHAEVQSGVDGSTSEIDCSVKDKERGETSSTEIASMSDGPTANSYTAVAITGRGKAPTTLNSTDRHEITCSSRDSEVEVEMTGSDTPTVSSSTQLLVSSADNEGRRILHVIDEIGRMELLSERFTQAVRSLFLRGEKEENVVVFATIPVSRQRSHWLLEELSKRKDCRIFEVSEKNRNGLAKELTALLLQNVSS